ncbi:MAG TPA: GGDEF domain-containing protein [Pseudonocardiaceae bacterium]
MGTREVSPQSWRGDSARALHALQSRWRTASLASGWPFPADWAIAEIDLVCAAVLAGRDLDQVLVKLGRARAEAGSGLGETLQDVAALHAVLTVPDNHDGMVSADPDATPARLLRVTAMAWSDVLVHQLSVGEVRDSLTGLANTAYLRARLREVYREATAGGFPPRTRYVLVVTTVDMAHATGWSRLAAMVLLADVLRTAFDGGQTLATIGPNTMVVLAERDGRISERAAATRWLTAARLGVDPQLGGIAVPSVWLESLPDTHEAACHLVADLAGGAGR